MGHYDEAIEDQYAEERARKRAKAATAIPLIIKSLNDAQVYLSRNSDCIVHAIRIEADIAFSISALKGQLGA